MSKKQQPTDKTSEIAFETINREIDALFKKLSSHGLCPCIVAHGMMYRGAFLHAEAVGVDETISLCLDIAATITHPDDAGVSDTQH